jgi:hypothetical protein
MKELFDAASKGTETGDVVVNDEMIRVRYIQIREELRMVIVAKEKKRVQCGACPYAK